MTVAPFTQFGLTDAAARTTYAVRLLETWIATTLRQQERCVLCLSGGSTPKPAYEELSASSEVEWPRLRLCLADERCVPPAHHDSNTLLLHETMGKRMEAEHVVVPNTHLTPQACSDDYEERVLRLLETGVIDILVLGMGDDGHIASLFPPVSNAALQRMGAVHTVTQKFAVHDRVSLTLPLLARAKHILLLLTGDAKRATWERCLAAPRDEKRWPLHALLDERLTVLTDWTS